VSAAGARSRNPERSRGVSDARVEFVHEKDSDSFGLDCLLIVAVLVGAFLMAAWRSNRAVLYHYGAAPEVPHGRSFVIMNPFRNRRPEEVAEELISDLRTNQCEQVLRELHSDDSRVCSTMQQNKHARLIWREDGSTSRVLVYHLPESNSNLWITSGRDPEIGFIVNRVSLIK